MEDRKFKSPVRKLLPFFERSRDGWKRKCKEAKVTVKRLANRVRSLEKSRDQWKEQARRQREELRRLQQELEKQKHTACRRPAAGDLGFGRTRRVRPTAR